MITLIDIAFSNFHGIEHMEVPLAGQGFVLMGGKNGSGKSTIVMDGPYYALFGKSLRYGDAPGAKVMRRGAKSMTVKLRIMDSATGQTITVVRARGAKGYEDGLSLFNADGTDFSLGKSKDSQAVLNQIIGMGPKTYKSSVVFSAELLGFPLFTPAQKQEIINDLLDLKALDEGLAATKVRIKEVYTELTALQSRQNRLEEDTTGGEAELKEFRLANAGFEKDRKDRIKTHEADKREWQTALESGKADVTTLESALAINLKKVEKLSLFIAGAEKEIRKTGAEQQAIKDAWGIRSAEAGAEVKRAEADLGHWQGLSGQASCPTCEMDIDPEQISVTVADWERRLSEAEKARKQVSDELAPINKKIAELEPARKYVEEERVKAGKLQRAADAIRRDLAACKERIATATALTSAATKAALAVANEQNPYALSITTTEGRIKSAKAELLQIEPKRVSLATELEEEQLIESCFGPKGSRNLLLQNVLPFLNNEAKRIKEITRSNIAVTFRVRGDTETNAGALVIEAENPVGAESYEGDSAGERKMVDFTILFSLLALVGSRGQKAFAHGFFDECLDTLDEEAQAAVSRLLRSIADTKSSIFVLSHAKDNAMSGFADKQWSVTAGKLSLN